MKVSRVKKRMRQVLDARRAWKRMYCEATFEFLYNARPNRKFGTTSNAHGARVIDRITGGVWPPYEKFDIPVSSFPAPHNLTLPVEAQDLKRRVKVASFCT